MTDIKQIYTSHQSLVGTVTPSVIRTVPFSLGGYAPSGKWYSPYNFGCYSSNQRLALACIFVYCKRGNIRATLIFADFAVFQQARIQKPAKIFAIFCMHILDT